MDVQVLDAAVSFRNQPFLKPLQISSGTITTITEATTSVWVESGGQKAEGRGSIYLSDLWAWPDPSLSHAQRDCALRELTSEIAANLRALCGGKPAHPLELGLRLHENVCSVDAPVQSLLARSMCLSPFDAAIHDGAGIAANLSAFDFYKDRTGIPSGDHIFGELGACASIARMMRTPHVSLPAWLIVSRGDDLERDVRPWITERGYRCFKVKILGEDIEDDAARTSEVFQAVRAFGAARPTLTADSNEGHSSAEAVREYLLELRRRDEDAFAALAYLEQPTARDILAQPFNWEEVTKLKPVLLDEGLTDLAILPEAQRQNWSGLALKTCKGHSFALTAAAWAVRNGLSLAMQDLTNPGLSLIHAALLSSRIPTLNGVELNSPQYTPAANEPWLPRLAGLFEPRDGCHRVPSPEPAGLGSVL